MKSRPNTKAIGAKPWPKKAEKSPTAVLKRNMSKGWLKKSKGFELPETVYCLLCGCGFPDDRGASAHKSLSDCFAAVRASVKDVRHMVYSVDRMR